MVLLQVGLRRTIELTQAAIREINLRNLASTALLSRGTLETACLQWESMNAIEEVVATGDPREVRRLLETFSKSLLGGKAKQLMIDETIRLTVPGERPLNRRLIHTAATHGTCSSLSKPLCGGGLGLRPRR